jgi:hypothetical protein
VLGRIAEERVQPGLLADEDQHRRFDPCEHLGIGGLGTVVGRLLPDLLHDERVDA